jgi:hypothetical protein
MHLPALFGLTEFGTEGPAILAEVQSGSMDSLPREIRQCTGM